LIPSPLKLPPQASLGAFPRFEKTEGGGFIDSTAQSKEHSKTEFDMGEFYEKVEELETFSRSKFSRDTGVTQ